jgi:hypothetical protein
LREVVTIAQSVYNASELPDQATSEDSTPFTLISYTPSEGEAGLIRVRVTAQDSEGNLLAYHFETSYKGATVGSVTTHYSLNETGASVSLTSDETSIILEATGIEGDMNWAAKYKVVPVQIIQTET